MKRKLKLKRWIVDLFIFLLISTFNAVVIVAVACSIKQVVLFTIYTLIIWLLILMIREK